MTHTTKTLLRAFLADESGPTAVEYAVMLMLIILVCISAIQTVGAWASGSWDHSSTELQNAMNN